MVQTFSSDVETMRHAILIARDGFGFVEPNPMVGAVIVSRDRTMIAQGSHQKFGEPHAEINAIRAAGELTHGADLFVSLEPCSHFGKTPPCTDAVLKAGFRRIIIGCQDPAPHAAGKGIQKLRDAGLEVVVGICEDEARRLIAPFGKLTIRGQPWVHAKWAMTLDGRIASRTGHSKWISCQQSQAWVHDFRSRMDAIITGAGTVRADDPRLTARPSGPRMALRVVVDSTGDSVTAQCQLVKTSAEAQVLVCVSQRCSQSGLERLHALGMQTLQTQSPGSVDVGAVLAELGRRHCTHVLLEAGPRLLGAFIDAELVDEVHAFIAPKIVGGEAALPPVGGFGLASIPTTPNMSHFRFSQIGDDLLLEGDCQKTGLQRGPGD